jgi:L-amino acid N-acyltransferase YncA
MKDDEIEVGTATSDDIDGILGLQERNQPEHGGSLSARLPRAWLDAAVASTTPVIVARRDGRVIGYLVAAEPAERAAYAGVPVVEAMLRAYPAAAPDAYAYGSICVDEAERGRRLAERMFDALRRRLPGREGALFIRRDNAASLGAHRRIGMREVGAFAHDGAEHVVLAYTG